MKCPACGTSIPAGSLGDVCPRCSLARALGSAAGERRHPDAPDGFELLYELGRGAMGVVWLARERALDRLVALKLIPTGSDPSLTARLLREGQAAARLGHPHIVRMHTLGGSGAATFLVMDFLEGGNLEQHLKENSLRPQLAARWVAALAGALAHAHAAGVLHRDLKPSNVLLDAGGEPQLADFGLAAPLAGRGDLTQHDQIVGTPAYLAPELLGGSSHASPQSDLYGLGAVLYYCLTGRPPFVGDSMASLLAQVADTEPVAPRLLQSGIPRDLETICLKCLEKQPGRRYESAQALQADLQRFARGEPIAARPVGVWGQTTRWCRRHPGPATAIGLAVLILLLFAVGGPLVAVRLERSRRATAEAAARATAITDFLKNDLLAQASPDNQPDRDLKLRTVLDQARAKIGGQFAGAPLVEAAIRETLADTYRALGDFATARQELNRVLALRESLLGPDDPASLQARSALAQALIGLGDYEGAGRLAQKTWATQARVLGAAQPDTLTTENILGETLSLRGRYADAEALLTRLLAVRRRVSGPESAATLAVMANLARVDTLDSHLAASEALYAESLATQRKLLGPEHPATLVVMNGLAGVYSLENKLDEALAMGRQVLEIRRRVLGAEHPLTVESMNDLASTYRDRGQTAEAAALIAGVWEIHQRVSGPEHPETVIAMINVAAIDRDQGKFTEATALGAQSVEICQRVFGPEHPYTIAAMANLASIDKFAGHLPEAATLGRQVLALRQRVLGPQHAGTLWSASDLGDILVATGQPAEADRLLQQTLELSVKASLEPWRTALTRTRAGAAKLALKQYADAEPLLREGYEGLHQDIARIPTYLRFEVEKARARLFELYTDWGKPDAAQPWKP